MIIETFKHFNIKISAHLGSYEVTTQKHRLHIHRTSSHHLQ